MRKTIIIICLIATIFSIFALNASATNSADRDAQKEMQGIAFKEMYIDTGDDTILTYTMPTVAYLETYGRTLNNNIGGAGAPNIRVSQRVTKPRNDLRHWRTTVVRQYVESPAKGISFDIADFVYNRNRYEELATYRPEFGILAPDVDEIQIVCKFKITAYFGDSDVWETLPLTTNITHSYNGNDAVELFPVDSINTALQSRFFNDECLISDFTITVSAHRNGQEATIGDFDYWTYTDTEQKTVAEFLNGGGRPNTIDDGTNFWDWLTTSTDSFLGIHIYHEFTIAHLLYCILGIAIVLVFIKIFAGG